jgi:group I intron endonuclease
MIGIYKIVNPKGRIYIGQSVNIELRRRNYEKLKCRQQRRLYSSLVKYGFSEHIFEVIEECSVEDLNTRERYWQDFYEVLSENGLNCRLTRTGDKSGKLSQEHKESISKALIGRKRVFSKEHRERCREAAIRRGVVPPSRKGKEGTMKGKKHSEESLNKMKKPKEEVNCPYCNKIGGIPQMKRWHFTNCKKRVG